MQKKKVDSQRPHRTPHEPNPPRFLLPRPAAVAVVFAPFLAPPPISLSPTRSAADDIFLNHSPAAMNATPRAFLGRDRWCLGAFPARPRRRRRPGGGAARCCCSETKLPKLAAVGAGGPLRAAGVSAAVAAAGGDGDFPGGRVRAMPAQSFVSPW